MSVNKNLSKLALNVDTNGDVTNDGLAVAYSSNGYTTSTFVSNTYFQNNNNPNAVTNGYFQATYTASDVLTKIKTVDGAGSGLDADLLDGSNSSFFLDASNINAGTLASGRLSGTYAISISGDADTVDGIEATALVSNNSLNTRLGGFASNNYIDNQLSTRIGIRATNTYVQATFTSNNYIDTLNVVSNNYFQDNAGGGATGGGSDEIFFENGQTVTTNYSITSGKNAMSAGPISINSGVTVTVPSGSEWTIV